MSGARGLPPTIERVLFLALGVVAVQAALIPLGLDGRLVPPDLLYGLVVAWLIRRPASAPLWAVLALGLFADVMLSRPIGLGALALVLVSEWFRLRGRLFHRSPFPLEWLAATLGFAAIMAAMHVALVMVMAPAPGLAMTLRHVLVTALTYPLIVFGLTWCLNLRAPRSQGFSGPSGRPR
jgi:rod shape-determining protein MreD